MPNTRISSEPDKFLTYMQVTDDRQLLDDPDNPGNPLFEKYKWTVVESTAWTEFRSRAESIFTQYNTEALVNDLIREQMFGLIKEVNEFDHGLSSSHHLLDKVALYGNITDWEIFRVKRSTTRSDESATRSLELGSLKPVITLRSSGPGEHTLTVNNPETPDSHALPDNVMFAELYRYINTADNPPTTVLNFEQIGVAKRGLYTSKFADLTFDITKKYYAWYMARYQGRDGELGLPSNKLIVLVDDSGHPLAN
jgi:hypothetical protein